MNLQNHWLMRGFGSTAVTPAILVALTGLTLWSLGQTGPTGHQNLSLIIVLTLVAVAAGCTALAWVRPQRAGVSPPHVMLSLGFGGMLLGLLFDLYHAGPARLDSLCVQSASLGFMDSFLLHLAFLPGMHIGMLAGGLLSIPVLRQLRPHCGRYLCSLFLQNVMCSGWMLAGMTMGALWFARTVQTAGSNTLPGMLGGMFVGMTWGMVISVVLYRSFFTLRKPPHLAEPLRSGPQPPL